MARTKSVNLREDQIKWIKNNNLNFSSWVRDQVDQEMPRTKE